MKINLQPLYVYLDTPGQQSYNWLLGSLLVLLIGPALTTSLREKYSVRKPPQFFSRCYYEQCGHTPGSSTGELTSQKAFIS